MGNSAFSKPSSITDKSRTHMHALETRRASSTSRASESILRQQSSTNHPTRACPPDSAQEGLPCKDWFQGGLRCPHWSGPEGRPPQFPFCIAPPLQRGQWYGGAQQTPSVESLLWRTVEGEGIVGMVIHRQLHRHLRPSMRRACPGETRVFDLAAETARCDNREYPSRGTSGDSKQVRGRHLIMRTNREMYARLNGQK